MSDLTTLRNDIERLTKQKQAIEDQVNLMASQTEQHYAKRREAAQSFEAIKRDHEEFLKNLAKEKDIIKKSHAELEKKRQDLELLKQSLNDRKEAFSRDRKTYQEKAEEQAKLRETLEARYKELEAKEKDMRGRQDELDILITGNKNTGKRLQADQEKLSQAINSASSKETEFNKRLEDITKEHDEIVKGLRSKEKDLLEKDSEFQKSISPKKNELELIEKALKKRELEIARREKELNKMALDLKAQKEQLEIEEGRKVVAHE